MHLLVGGPGRAWNVFLACKDYKKTWTFWDAYMSSTWCSNIVQTEMKETDYSFAFDFLVLTDKVASSIGLSFFRLCFGIQIEVFSYFTFAQTFAFAFQIWFQYKLIDFCFFLWVYGSFRRP